MILRILTIMLFTVSFAYAGFNVNFRDMEMSEFLSFVSEFTGKNFVYDKKYIKGQITIDSSSEIKSDDIMEIFASTMRANGLEVIDRGSYAEIIKQGQMVNMDDSEGSGDGNALVTTVISARNFDAKIMATALARLKSRMGYVEVLKGMNSVVMRDRINKIAKVKSLMQRLDNKAEGFTIRSVKIDNASAKNLADRLQKLYSNMRKKMLVGNEPVIVADEYSNILLVASEERDFDKIKYIISQLDSATSGSRNAPKVFYLNNANAEDVEKVLNKLTGVANKSKGKKSAIKSTVAYDKATNSIIAYGDQELYSRVEKLIGKLDVPREQVYVEALILETSFDSGNKFGVEWQAGGKGDSEIGSIGFINPNGSYLNPYQKPVTDGGIPGALPGGFSMGVLGNIITYQGIKFPTLGAFVNFSESANEINLLSNPQILTLDNEEAEVFVGENRPFLTSTKYDSNNNPVQSYDYRDVGVKLKIKPQISSNDTITLSIYQEVKKVTGSAGSTAPITLTRSTKTKVKLKDGSMMVISGLLKDDSESRNTAVPGLSRIPVLGWLFKNKSSGYDKTNMMVFISTQIIRTQADAEEMTKKKRKETVSFKAEIDDKIKKEF